AAYPRTPLSNASRSCCRAAEPSAPTMLAFMQRWRKPNCIRDALHHGDRLFDRLRDHVVGSSLDSVWIAGKRVSCSNRGGRLVAESFTPDFGSTARGSSANSR